MSDLTLTDREIRAAVYAIVANERVQTGDLNQCDIPKKEKKAEGDDILREYHVYYSSPFLPYDADIKTHPPHDDKAIRCEYVNGDELQVWVYFVRKRGGNANF